MILLFDQSSDFTPDQFEKLDEMFAHRENFSHIDWMRTFHLTAPVGITGFYSGWEETCDALHERMGYVPAPMYFSPKMEAEAEAARTEQARVDLFRDLVLSDIFPPDVVDPSKLPPLGTIAMTIEYDNEYTVEDGQKIPASQAEREPAVAFYPHPQTFDANGNPECNLYTLLLVDPDAPSRIHHDMREFIYWAVLNINDADVSKGDLALSYMGPAPAYASGLHRYVFCLYKQKKPFSPAQVKQSADFFSVRKGICSFDWVTSQQDILQAVPVGVEAFLSEWDLSVDDAHAAMGYMPPEQFWSPSQRRSALIAEADAARSGSSPMLSISGGHDLIKTRLQQIQEANDRFNQQVTVSSRKNVELGTLSNPNSPKGLEEHTFDAKADAEAAAQREAQNAPKKVANRKPVTLGGAAKSLSAKDAANASLSVSLTEDSSASAAAALRESAEDKTAVVTSSREEVNNSSVSVSKRAEHHTDQTQKAHTVNENRRQSSDGHYSEERSESLNEQHHEERAEKSEFHQKSQSKATSSPREFSNGQTADTSVERVRSHELHELSAREQQSQVKQLQIEAEQRQNEELQQQQQVRRQQQAEMERQQREVLERQAQEQQRQLRLQQEQQEQEQQQRRAARRQREREEQESREREAQKQQQREQQEQQQRRAARRQREEQERERQQQDAYEQQMRSQTAPSSSRRQQQEEQNVQSSSRSSTRSAPTGRAPDEHKDSSPQAKNRKDKKDRDFFSAPPDSEYSDTDNGSMMSSEQEADRNKQQAQQQQSPQKGQKSSSTLRPQGHAAVDVDDAPSESDASSVLPALAPRGGDSRQQTASRRMDSSTGGGGGGGSSQQRYKQLLEALATVKSASQLCDLFNVTTSTIFAGGKSRFRVNTCTFP